MDTLLAYCADRLDISEFLAHLVDGLKDDHDIKVLCHMMLGKLVSQASSTGRVLAASLDLVTDPLRNTICATLKESAVKQQVERHEELVRSGMRAAHALEKMPGSDSCVKFDEFVRSTVKTHPLYATVCEE
uniref:TATA-binding protein interacting (TIP20) domain-containing protein n=2 Tax=Prymnesium polylepis TaxID=72548 RepID=A0A7S4HEB9_9EUKA|mmetsp:Transcript_13558/g.34598  ORF Transcript_13558/g.34598 Transcript_13558/m.34598 type:complete len:131 (+) Transcript_13558:142-534(+)